MLLFILACAQPTLDTGGPAPMPLLTVPCPPQQTITLAREGALDSLAMCRPDGPCTYVWGWMTGEGLTVACGVGGSLEVQWATP